MRINRKNDENTISNKIFDFSAKTIKQLRESGYSNCMDISDVEFSVIDGRNPHYVALPFLRFQLRELYCRHLQRYNDHHCAGFGPGNASTFKENVGFVRSDME